MIKDQRKELKKLEKVEKEIQSRMNVTEGMEEQVYGELSNVRRVRK